MTDDVVPSAAEERGAAPCRGGVLRFVLVAFAPALLMTRCVWPELPSTTGDQDHLPTVSVAAPWIDPVFTWTPLIVAGALLLLLFWRRRWWFPGAFAAWAAFGVVLVGLCGRGFAHPLGELRLRDEQAGPSGETYALLSLPVMGGGVDYLARRTSGDFLRSSYEIVQQAGDDPPALRPVIRPQTGDEKRVVWFGRGGVVVVAGDGRCLMAYDTRRNPLQPPEEIVSLSPFALLGDADTGRETDLAAVAAMVREPSPRPEALPLDADLVAALDSPNAWIRAASRRIVAAGGATLYPEATRRLASAPK